MYLLYAVRLSHADPRWRVETPSHISRHDRDILHQDRVGAWLAGNSTIINPTAVAVVVDNKKPFLQETSPGARWLGCLSKLHLQG